jgi:hypothetical protein
MGKISLCLYLSLSLALSLFDLGNYSVEFDEVGKVIALNLELSPKLSFALCLTYHLLYLKVLPN